MARDLNFAKLGTFLRRRAAQLRDSPNQAEMGARINRSQAFIARLYQGALDVSITDLAAIRQAWDVPFEVLFQLLELQDRSDAPVDLVERVGRMEDQLAYMTTILERLLAQHDEVQAATQAPNPGSAPQPVVSPDR